MTMLELLKEYPNSAKIVRQWFLDKMLDGLNDKNIPDGFKELIKQKGVDDEKITDILQNNPRSLFDVFDSNEIYVNVTWTEDSFWWAVNSAVYQEKYSTRLEAEKAAIAEAFKLLNEKL
jgi:hypothetical protein